MFWVLISLSQAYVRKVTDKKERRKGEEMEWN
jgi:hypothetical protein